MAAPRVSLRPLLLTDAQALSDVLLDDVDAVRMTGSVPEPATAAAITDWLSARLGRDDARLYAVLLDDSTLAGFTCFYLEPLEGGSNFAEIGYVIDRRQRGQGIGLAAARLTLDLAWATGARRLKASVFPHNTASPRVLAKLGFTYAGQEEQMLPARGGLRISDIYWLDREHEDGKGAAGEAVTVCSGAPTGGPTPATDPR